MKRLTDVLHLSEFRKPSMDWNTVLTCLIRSDCNSVYFFILLIRLRIPVSTTPLPHPSSYFPLYLNMSQSQTTVSPETKVRADTQLKF